MTLRDPREPRHARVIWIDFSELFYCVTVLKQRDACPTTATGGAYAHPSLGKESKGNMDLLGVLE
jgi:hypothetical protein